MSLILLTSACSIFPSAKEKVVVQTKVNTIEVPLQEHPKSIKMYDIQWYVVTNSNIDKFIEDYKNSQGQSWVFYSMSVDSYERLALNVAEMRRYINQQKAIIAYYEKAVKPKTMGEQK